MTETNALVDQLRRENRSLKIAVVVALTVMTCAALTAQPPPAERITAQEFVLVSESGETRALLNMAPHPTLSFYDEDREPTMILGMGADGPVLGAIRPDGTPYNYLNPDPHVNPLR